jgi:hypothetical protein
MELIQSIDFLGKEPHVYIFNQRRYKTLFGGCMSILATLAIASLSLYFIINALMRKQVNVISNETQQFNKTLGFSEIPFLYYPADLKGVLYPANIAYPVFQYWAYFKEKKGNVTIIDLPARRCNLKDVAGYEDLFVNFPNLQSYWCPEKPNNLTLFGNYGDIVNGYAKYHAYISPCTNGSIYNPNADRNACASPEVIAASLTKVPLHFYTTYVDHDIDFQNQTHPFVPYIKTEDFSMTFQNKNSYVYYIKKLYIESDMGLVFEDPVTVDKYTAQLVQSITLAGSNYFVPEAFGLFLVALHDKANMHKRSYLKLQALAANVGGVMNFILIFAQFITAYVSGKQLLLDIVNHRIDVKGGSDLGGNSMKGGDMSRNNLTSLKLNNYTQVVPQVPTNQTR